MHFNRSITYKYPNVHREVSLTGTKNNKARKAQIEGLCVHYDMQRSIATLIK